MVVVVNAIVEISMRVISLIIRITMLNILKNNSKNFNIDGSCSDSSQDNGNKKISDSVRTQKE